MARLLAGFLLQLLAVCNAEDGVCDPSKEVCAFPAEALDGTETEADDMKTSLLQLKTQPVHEGTPNATVTRFIDLTTDPAVIEARHKRLREGEVIKVYHQTTQDACKAIIDSRFYVGQYGLAGGGIYTATTAGLTFWKAQKFGCIIELYIATGKVKELPYHGDQSITLEAVVNGGYDSTWLPRGVPHGAAPEYVVYFSDQVLAMAAYPSDRHGNRIGGYFGDRLPEDPPAFWCSEDYDCGPTPPPTPAPPTSSPNDCKDTANTGFRIRGTPA